MIPFHLWLPETHVECATGGSVLLAAILLKLGSFGLLRYLLPLFHHSTLYFLPLVQVLSVLGIIYSSLVCLGLIDIKKIIAYSSVGHMNLSVLGTFSNDLLGISGSIFFLISHGLISSGLFLLVGVLYDRFHTRVIKYYRGLVLLLPLFTLFFFFFSLANVAVPGTSGFISEFFTLLGLFHSNLFLALLASSGIILAPSYALWLYHRLAFGSLSPFFSRSSSDLTLKEFHLLSPLSLLVLVLGLAPDLLFSYLLLPSYLLLHP